MTVARPVPWWARLLGLRGWTLPEPLVKPWGGVYTAGQDTSAQSVIGLPAVYACIRLLTSAVSRLPVDVLIDQAGVPRPYPSPRWLRQPILGNANANRITHFGQVMASLLIDGNAFVLVLRDDSYDVRELYVLDPRNVEIARGTEGDPIYRVRGRNIKEVDDQQMVHLPLQPFPGQDRGLSPIEAARQVFGTGLATQEYQARFFTDAATPPGYIAVPKDTKVDATELKKNWLAAREKNIHEPGVLTGGAEFKQLSLTNEQAQFVELRKLTMQEAAMIYGVPPHMIGDVERSTSWGTGIEQQGIGFVTYTLNDYLVLIEEGYRRLVPNPQSYMRFNRNGLLRGDAKSRVEVYKGMWEIGALSPDEIRGKEDLPPLESGLGDQYFTPLNYAPLSATPAEAEPEPEPEPPVEPQNGQMRLAEALLEIAELRGQVISFAARPVPAVRLPPPVTFEQGAFQFHAAPVTVEAPAPPPPAQVTIEKGAIEVHSAPVTVEAPPAPVLTIEAGAIQYHAGPTTIEAPPPAQVTIEAGAIQHHSAPISVQAPPPAQVNVTIPSGKRKVLRDKDGRITGTESA